MHLAFFAALIAFAAHSDPSTPVWTTVRYHDLTCDGLLDRIAVDETGHLSVFVNRGSRTFVKVDQELPPILATDFLFTDLDTDGIVDVYVCAVGNNLALRGDGAGHLLDVTAQLGLRDGGRGISAQRIDVDGDDSADILLQNQDRSVVFWARGDGSFQRDMVVSASTSLDMPGPFVPTGAILPFAGSQAPPGYLLCDGSEVNRFTFSQLFSTVGITYGFGNAIDTFNLPDLTQRIPLGKANSGTGSVLGELGGAIDHSHTGAVHTHLAPGHGHGFNLGTSSNGNHNHSVSGSTGSGGSHSHSLSGSTSPNGSHGHTFQGRSNSAGNFGTNNVFPRLSTNNSSNTSTSTAPDHTHSISGTANAAGSHTHTFSGSTTSSGSHSHGVSGSVGNNALNGDAALPTTANTASTTGSANPPYLVINYIIKY